MRASIALAVAACALSVAACGDHDTMTTHPDVMVDASFTGEQMTDVMAANWEAMVPAVRFHVAIVDHDAVLALATKHASDDTAYVIATYGQLAHALFPTA